MEEFLRKLSAIWARALKKVRQPCSLGAALIRRGTAKHSLGHFLNFTQQNDPNKKSIFLFFLSSFSSSSSSSFFLPPFFLILFLFYLLLFFLLTPYSYPLPPLFIIIFLFFYLLFFFFLLLTPLFFPLLPPLFIVLFYLLLLFFFLLTPLFFPSFSSSFHHPLPLILPALLLLPPPHHHHHHHHHHHPLILPLFFLLLSSPSSSICSSSSSFSPPYSIPLLPPLFIIHFFFFLTPLRFPSSASSFHHPAPPPPSSSTCSFSSSSSPPYSSSLLHPVRFLFILTFPFFRNSDIWEEEIPFPVALCKRRHLNTHLLPGAVLLTSTGNSNFLLAIRVHTKCICYEVATSLPLKSRRSAYLSRPQRSKHFTHPRSVNPATPQSVRQLPGQSYLGKFSATFFVAVYNNADILGRMLEALMMFAFH